MGNPSEPRVWTRRLNCTALDGIGQSIAEVIYGVEAEARIVLLLSRESQEDET